MNAGLVCFLNAVKFINAAHTPCKTTRDGQSVALQSTADVYLLVTTGFWAA